MIQYATLGTDDLARSKQFYDALLAAVDVQSFYASSEALAYAKNGSTLPALWIVSPYAAGPASGGNGPMLAFDATSREQVQSFHRIALAQGGSSEGEPGYREQYAPFFYAAYVRDPFGNKLACVFRDPERGAT